MVTPALTQAPRTRPPRAKADAREQRAARDSILVVLAGQVERVIGTLTALILRWCLDPARLGVYTGLRLFLDNTNRSSLGVSLGAVQEIPILRAAGREREAEHIANVAHTTNTITCLFYAAGLIGLAVWRAPGLAGSGLAREWTWGLIAVAGLALIKRYETFLVAVLRARQEFAATSRGDVFEALVTLAAVAAGLLIAGFWGLLAGLGVILASKIAYLRRAAGVDLRWAWDWPIVARLFRTGLPILANTLVFGCVLGVDRFVLLNLPDGERALGLYSIAIMGSSWCLDLAGRVVLVLYPYFQTAWGQTSDAREVAERAARATEAQAPILAAGTLAAFALGPDFLTWLVPRYAAGIGALRPLLPGVLLLSLAWPARQMLIAIGKPYRLCAATGAGLAVLASLAWIGAQRGGIEGAARGTSIGYGCVYLLTTVVAFVPHNGWRAWLVLQLRIAGVFAYFASGAWVSAHLSAFGTGFSKWLIAGCVVGVWTLPVVWTLRGHRGLMKRGAVATDAGGA